MVACSEKHPQNKIQNETAIGCVILLLVAPHVNLSDRQRMAHEAIQQYPRPIAHGSTRDIVFHGKQHGLPLIARSQSFGRRTRACIFVVVLCALVCVLSFFHSIFK